MKKWEYKTIDRSRKSKSVNKVNDELNQQGKLGWELVSYEEYTSTKTKQIRVPKDQFAVSLENRTVIASQTPKVKCVFKRPIE